MPAENPEPGRPDRRRAYEDAVLAALDFDPADDPIPATRRPYRPGLRLALLAVLHVLFAVLFAELLAGNAGGPALIAVGAAWLAGTVLIARTIFRAGSRLLHLPA